MSGGNHCKSNRHRPFWVVTQRKSNLSAFNGYRYTPSDYSEVRCTFGTCRHAVWRTKAKYVDELPDACRCRDAAATKHCRICREVLCVSCFTDHHHEGHGTPATDTR